MGWLSDSVVSHLQQVVEAADISKGKPDLAGTKYELLDEIGRGGMGSVYLVLDRELKRNVALKVLDIGVNPLLNSLVNPLLNPLLNPGEARILAFLEHPGIVPVHDAGTLADGRAYYAMKFVQGKRLDVYAGTHPPVTELLRVFVRVCEPVAFAHSQGIVHRDLKPENIMTGNFGEVLVLDWGVAKTTAERATQGTIIGTREYMAPEQAVGDIDQVDARSDIYALGRIFSYLLTACCGDAIPRPLRAIAAKAAHLDRASRYSSALDLAADVERYLEGRPVAAHRENILERSNRLLSRHKTLVSLLAAYIMMRIVLFLMYRR